MDLSPSPLASELPASLREFMTARIHPAEPKYETWRRESGEVGMWPGLVGLKQAARERGVWNLAAPGISGLSNVHYGYLAEVTARSPELRPVSR